MIIIEILQITAGITLAVILILAIWISIATTRAVQNKKITAMQGIEIMHVVMTAVGIAIVMLRLTDTLIGGI